MCNFWKRNDQKYNLSLTKRTEINSNIKETDLSLSIPFTWSQNVEE